MKQSREILKRYWGYDNFRPLQEDIIDESINGADVLALLPTGGGKSICFQVPGMAREGICLVISPLIALMNDQVEQLNQRGIKAIAITSGMSYREIDIALDNVRFGDTKFLYTSPERLQTRLFKERFKQMKVALIVVDEAHCISEWGHDFRPPYRKIAQLREMHPHVPFMALTATATEDVKDDIILQLGLKNVRKFEGNFQRPNISYEVYPVRNKLKAILEVCRRFQDQSGIIYCQRRKSVKEVALWLQRNNVAVGTYHGGMKSDERNAMMKSWISNQNKVMVATNAFGMGIDKADVRFVAHYEFPVTPEAYFQEAGRAGRDGEESRTFVFYEEKDLEANEEIIQKQFPDLEVIKNCYRALCNYLKIAIGSGENESFPLDIKQFCKQFKLDIYESYQSLKILEMNGDLLLSENFFHPTTLKFLIGNRELYNFQIKHERLAGLITLLSRSYTGIFDQFVRLDEQSFAKRLGISESELSGQLQYLEHNGVIDINWKTDLPLLTLTHERFPDSQFNLKAEIYHERKKQSIQRWKVMREFLESDLCRAKFLIAYFGQDSEDCGKCDYCLRKLAGHHPENVEISQLMMDQLRAQAMTLDELIDSFKNLDRSVILASYKALLKEEQILLREGLIYPNSK